MTRHEVLEPTQMPEPQRDLTEAEILLLEWLAWWATDDSAPAKMPEALHIRTVLALLTINEAAVVAVLDAAILRSTDRSLAYPAEPGEDDTEDDTVTEDT